MNDKDIKQFITAFKDFMKHAQSQEFNMNSKKEYDRYQEESKMMIESEIEKKAAEMEVTVDYYIAEFM
jgi:hypothetical protein